jgi:Zn-dependent M28 family amino/carboxypeptidase
MKNKNKLKVKSLMFKVGIPFLFGLLLFSCNTDNDKIKKPGTSSTTQVIEKVPVPAFNPDSAYKYVKEQVEFGPRVPNSDAHVKCGNYLIDKLKSFGISVKVQEFEAKAYDGTILKLRNIIASINPDASQRILLSAHWDTRPFADQDTKDKEKPIDGANDGGSGVGVLMEIARVLALSPEKPKPGIDIILFDGEDYGAPWNYEGPNTDTYCLGSQYWAKNKENYSAFFGILLDMVGAKDAKFAMEGTSMQFAPTIVKVVWNQAHELGYGNYFLMDHVTAITDDHYYINQIASVPTIDIIEYNPTGDNFFGDYWHTHEDNMSVIDKNTLKAVGQTVLEVVYNGYKKLI